MLTAAQLADDLMHACGFENPALHQYVTEAILGRRTVGSLYHVMDGTALTSSQIDCVLSFFQIAGVSL